MRIGNFHIGRLRGRRRYDGAVVNRLTSDWVFSHESARKEIEAGLETIRARARDLERNNDIVRRYLALVESNIVGKAGFILRIQSSDERARTVEREFARWLDSADASGQLSGVDLQRLVIRSTARDGESLAIFVEGKSYPDGIGLRVLESDYLPRNKTDTKINQFMGVTIDDTGRPIKYTLTNAHPGDRYTDQLTKDYDAERVIHVYREERPGQTRAVSWLASSMIPLKMLGGYQEAELVASRISACQMGFYTLPPGNDFGGDGTDAAGNPVSDAAPGTFERLPSGWDFKPFTPQHPTSQYSAFVKQILRQIAAGLGVSYSALANDGSDANYSSMREMSILERENWMVLQDWFARKFMRRLYRKWIATPGAKNRLNFDPSPFATLDEWTGKTWPWVDPKHDAEARESDVRMGLTAPSVLAEEKGVNFKAMVARIAEDDKTRTAAGLPSMFAQSVEPQGVSNE